MKNVNKTQSERYRVLKSFACLFGLVFSFSLVFVSAQTSKNKKVTVKLLWHKKDFASARVGRPEVPKAFKGKPDTAPYHYVKSLVGGETYLLDKDGNIKKEIPSGTLSRGAFPSDNGEYFLVLTFKGITTKSMEETAHYTMYDEDGNVVWEKDGVFTLQAYVSNQGEVAALAGEWYRQVLMESRAIITGVVFYDKHGNLKGVANLDKPFVLEDEAPEQDDYYDGRARFSGNGKNFFLNGSKMYCFNNSGDLLGSNSYTHLITAVSQDGNFVAVVGKLFNNDCNEIILPQPTRILAFSPEGNYFAWYPFDYSKLTFSETKTLKKIWQVEGYFGGKADISLNGKYTVVGGIALFNKSGAKLWHEKKLMGKAKISKNSRYFVTGNAEGLSFYEIHEE